MEEYPLKEPSKEGLGEVVIFCNDCFSCIEPCGKTKHKPQSN